MERAAGPVENYQKLIAWQKGIDLVTLVYEITAAFPKEEIYGLTSQIRRAAVSIPANIAEGQGRSSTSDFLRFLSIASGSLKEVETHVFIAERLRYINGKESCRLLELAAEIGRLIKGLTRALKKKLAES